MSCWHTSSRMVFAFAILDGAVPGQSGCKFCMQITQIYTSSSDDDCDFFTESGGSFGLCLFCGCVFLRWLLSLFCDFFIEVGSSFSLCSFCSCLFLVVVDVTLLCFFPSCFAHHHTSAGFSWDKRYFSVMWAQHFSLTYTPKRIFSAVKSEYNNCGVAGVPLNISQNFWNIPRVYLQNT